MRYSIVPLTRLPRRFSFFDYTAPTDLQTQLRAGQFVRIPFRNSEMFGVIVSVSPDEKKDESLKEISGLAHPEPIISSPLIGLYQTIADVYGVAISTLLRSVLPPLQKRKLQTISFIPQILNLDSKKKIKSIYYKYVNNTEHADAIKSSLREYSLIIVPEIQKVEEVFSLLTVEQQEQTVIWHGDLTQKEQYDAWLQIRNGVKKIIIGTRGVVLLPLQQLQSIIIDYEQDASHKQSDQAPRFSTLDIAPLLSSVYGARINYLSFSPSAERFFGVRKGHIDGNLTIDISKKEMVVVDMADEKKKGNRLHISEAVIEDIKAQRGNVLCYLNRTGYANIVICKNCQQTIICSVCHNPYKYYETTNTLQCQTCRINLSVPDKCSNCSHALFHLAGAGTERLEKELSELFSKTHRIVRIEKDCSDNFSTFSKNTIFIGTKAIFSRVPFETISTLVYADMDAELRLPEYRAHEDVWHTIAQMNILRKDDSCLFLQTYSPQHALIKSLQEPERWYRTELNSRQMALYPPYVFLVKYLIPGVSTDESWQKAKRYYESILAQLTEERSAIILGKPIPAHPLRHAGKVWHVLWAKCPTERWMDHVLFLNSFFGHDVKIDPNPLSIVSW